MPGRTDTLIYLRANKLKKIGINFEPVYEYFESEAMNEYLNI